MPDPMAGLPPRFLRTPEAARYLGLSGRTLEKHRTYGTGPTYRKIGGRVVYGTGEFASLAPELPPVSPDWSPIAVEETRGYNNSAPTPPR